MTPAWGVKKNSEGKNIFWYGFKVHLLVDCQSQYILTALLSSGNINDGKMVIPSLMLAFKIASSFGRTLLEVFD